VLSDEGKEIELKEADEGALKTAAELGIDFRNEMVEEETDGIKGLRTEAEVEIEKSDAVDETEEVEKTEKPAEASDAEEPVAVEETKEVKK